RIHARLSESADASGRSSQLRAVFSAPRLPLSGRRAARSSLSAAPLTEPLLFHSLDLHDHTVLDDQAYLAKTEAFHGPAHPADPPSPRLCRLDCRTKMTRRPFIRTHVRLPQGPQPHSVLNPPAHQASPPIQLDRLGRPILHATRSAIKRNIDNLDR